MQMSTTLRDGPSHLALGRFASKVRRKDMGQLARIAALLFALSLGLVDPHCRICYSQDDSQLAQVLRDWRDRQLQISRVKYVAKGTYLIPKGRTSNNTEMGLEGEVPATDLTLPYELSVTCDFRRTWLRIEQSVYKWQEGREVPRLKKEVGLFDGEQYQVFLPRKSNPNRDAHDVDLFIRRPEAAGLIITPSELAPFFGHGAFVQPITQHSLREGLLINPAPSAYRVSHEVDDNGRKQLVLRTGDVRSDGSFYEVWVDMPRQSAVTRWRHVHPAYRREIAVEYQETSHGWLAKKWRFTLYDKGKLTKHQEVNVSAIEIDLPLTRDMFFVRPTPGMIVYDQVGKREYVAAEDGQPDLSKSVSQLRALGDRDVYARRGFPWSWVLVVVGAVMTAAAIAMRCLKRVRSSSQGKVLRSIKHD